jgi:hypothetical protein
MKAHGKWLLLLLATGCSSPHPLENDASENARGSGGAAGDAPGGAAGGAPGGAAGGATGGAPGASTDGGSVDCGPPMRLAPCRTNSDCRSAYLVCVPPDYVTIELCRDPDAGVEPDPACPFSPEFSTAPICPQTVRVTSPVCEVRYQRPCTVDGDCGPAGFICTTGSCQWPDPPGPCASASECPAEWSCSAPCACPGTVAMKVCEPPFAEFHCPPCALTPN